MSRGERLTYYMDSKGFNARDLSRASGVAYTTIRSMIERDLVNASIDNTIKICRALNIEVDDILKENQSRVAEGVASYKVRQGAFTYRYHPTPVSAGLPSTIEGTPYEEISVPDELMGKYANSSDIFFLKVNGDSMNKVIPHNSMIAVKEIEITELQNDDIVVFSNGNEYSVKRYFNDVDNSRHIFNAESLDKSFTAYTVDYNDTENLVLHGKVVLYIVSTD